MTLRTLTGRISKKRRTSDPNEVIQVLIVLMGADPLVWRRIVVPIHYSFWDLHVAIQDSMGWLDYHLHEFQCQKIKVPGVQTIGIPVYEGYDPPAAAGWTIPIEDFFDWYSPTVLQYDYDFGDDWHHLIAFEDRYPSKPGVKYPRCISGARKCPPEDCGGVHGYHELLDAMKDKKHPEYRDLVNWLGGRFNADDFSPDRVKFDDPDERWEIAFKRGAS